MKNGGNLGLLGPVSWRPTTVKWRQPAQSNRHSTIGTWQTEYHEALPSSVNVQSHLTSSFADGGNASWYSVCRVPMVEWGLDCEDCRHLTVVGLHNTGPCLVFGTTIAVLVLPQYTAPLLRHFCSVLASFCQFMFFSQLIPLRVIQRPSFDHWYNRLGAQKYEASKIDQVSLFPSH